LKWDRNPAHSLEKLLTEIEGLDQDLARLTELRRQRATELKKFTEALRIVGASIDGKVSERVDAAAQRALPSEVGDRAPANPRAAFKKAILKTLAAPEADWATATEIQRQVETSLGQRYHRNTARRTLDRLVLEGVVIKESGRYRRLVGIPEKGESPRNHVRRPGRVPGEHAFLNVRKD
jgi:hypothetical protein